MTTVIARMRIGSQEYGRGAVASDMVMHLSWFPRSGRAMVSIWMNLGEQVRKRPCGRGGGGPHHRRRGDLHQIGGTGCGASACVDARPSVRSPERSWNPPLDEGSGPVYRIDDSSSS